MYWRLSSVNGRPPLRSRHNHGVRLAGRSLVAAILVGLTAVAACQPTGPTSAPASPRATTESASPSAAGEVPDAGLILGAWRPEPVPIPASLVPKVDQACRANLGRDFPAGATLALIDARGGGVVQAYFASADGAWASCTHMVVDPLGGVSAGRGHAVSAGGLADLTPFELEFTDFTWSSDHPITASYLVGRAGAGVARVEIRSPGQPSILASSANGWWAAWIHGPTPARWSIVALDAVGREVDSVDGVPQDSP
jgi:hypothetical protein